MLDDAMFYEWLDSLDDSILIETLEKDGYIVTENYDESINTIEGYYREIELKGKDECGEKEIEKIHEWIKQKQKQIDTETNELILELKRRGYVAMCKHHFDRLEVSAKWLKDMVASMSDLNTIFDKDGKVRG